MKTSTTPSKALHITLWVVQIIIGSLFLMAGFSKATQPMDILAQNMPWTSEAPELLVRFIGLCESLGAIGLLLPSVLRIKPHLTVYAALGLSCIQIFAAIFHSTKGELNMITINLVLASFAIFIFWGRLKKAPILAR